MLIHFSLEEKKVLKQYLEVNGNKLLEQVEGGFTGSHLNNSSSDIWIPCLNVQQFYFSIYLF